jgi:hypothetical protein
MGLTYASKLLRFLDPEQFGALDNRLRDALIDEHDGLKVPRIHEYEASQLVGYMRFLEVLKRLSADLTRQKIVRPNCSFGEETPQWRAADIEMAMFQWAQEKLNKKRADKRKA